MTNALFYKLKPEAHQDLMAADDPAAVFNMSGDYSYLTSGYYESLDAELSGAHVLPTSQDALDAYVVPIAMEKARQHGIATPDYDIVVEKLRPPVLAYPINPFSNKCEIVLESDNIAAKLKALTMTGKYATICQRLPSDYRIDVVRCTLGKTLVKEYGSFAKQLFQVFRLPLMRARVIVTTTDYLLSAIEPLPFDDLTLNEKKVLQGLGTWQK
jgi:hypothetical protein